MLPNVKLTKTSGNTGVVRPGAAGILAIIAASSLGTANQPASYTNPSNISTDFGYGRLTSYAAYTLTETQNPVLLIQPTTATAGTYGAVTFTGTGTSIVTGDAVVKPYDEWTPYLIVVAGGTIGVTGITFQYSLDGGTTLSAVTALGTANTFTIPNSGIKLNFAAGTLVAGDTVAVATCTPPYATTTDLTAALEALRVTQQPWDAVLIDGPATSTVISQLDTWLAGLEAAGVYKSAIVNLRRKNVGETEAAYATAMQTIVSATATTRVVVCADGADMVDYFQAVLVPRPASLYVAARGEAIDLGQDPAFVATGPLHNCAITDVRANPKYHDENLYPGLDAMRLTTLRSFHGTEGVFITNANLLSAGGSDYVYWQHLRVMNAACTVAYQILQGQLSKGVQKSSTVGPSGQRYIAEEDAASIEGLVNAALTNPMRGRCSSFLFTLSRTDDISSNQGAKINATLQIVALAYVKEFDVTAGFAKSIVAPLAA